MNEISKASGSSSSARHPWRGVAAGLLAGLAAAAAMEAAQAMLSAAGLDGGSGGDDNDPATLKAADAATETVAGRSVPEPYRGAAGHLVHYLVGAGLGGLYGWAAEYRPEVTAGFGSAYGLATSALLDEAAVPAAGLAKAPWNVGAGTHLYGAVSHLVFGSTLESARALLGGRD